MARFQLRGLNGSQKPFEDNIERSATMVLTKDEGLIRSALASIKSQLLIENFVPIHKEGDTDSDIKFQKAGDIIIKDGKVIFELSGDTSKFNLIYLITADRYVLKIGGSAAGLRSRMSSYTAGTEENRKRGTCATTNYQVFQALLRICQAGYKVELFACRIPLQPMSVPLPWNPGVLIKADPEIYQPIEKYLIDEYCQQKGGKPPLNQKAAL